MKFGVKRFGIGKGQGMMIMDIVMPNLNRQEKLIGKKSYGEQGNISAHVEQVISRKNSEITFDQFEKNQKEMDFEC